MKHIIRRLLPALLILLLTVAIVSCGDTDETAVDVNGIKGVVVPHTHTYDAWDLSEKLAWWGDAPCRYEMLTRECKECDDGTETRVIAVHQWEDGTCAICGATHSEGLSFNVAVSATDGATIQSVGTCIDTEIIVPDKTEDGRTVTAIAAGAFKDCATLTAITLPAGIRTIGANAFAGCVNLKTITFADGTALTSIGSYCFDRCALTSITLPATITEIPAGLFNNCKELTSVNFADLTALTSVGQYAFSGCEKLTGVTLADTVTSVGADAFADTKAATDGFVDGALYFDKVLVKVDAAASGKFTVKDDTAVIAARAFEGCKNLTEVVIPASVKNIGDGAFFDCAGLSELALPEDLVTIGASLCHGCGSLAKITIPAKVKTIGRYAFSGCDGLKEIVFAEGTALTSIGDAAFADCSALTSVELPASLTKIGARAFYGCDNLASLTLPFAGGTGFTGKKPTDLNETHFGYIFGAVNYFDNGAYVPASLKKVTLSGNYTLDDSAFYGCANIEEISVDATSLQKIGYAVFDGCASLRAVTLPKKVSELGDYSFRGCKSLTGLTLDADAKITAIGSYAFSGCTSLSTLADILADVETVDAYAFEGCTGIEEIVVPDGVSAIGLGAFANCDSLRAITLPFIGKNNNYKASTEDGFYFGYIFGASAAKDEATAVYVPDNRSAMPASLTSVTLTGSICPPYAFYGCSNLEEVVFDKEKATIKTIEDYAFSGCSGLESFTFQSKVTKVGKEAFRGCTGLSAIKITTNLKTITASAFAECSGVEEITLSSKNSTFTLEDGCLLKGTTLVLGCKNSEIPSSVTEIGAYAFSGVKGLGSIEIPKKVKKIGNNAFEFCTGLTSVELPSALTAIGNNAFYGCEDLTGIEIPKKVTSIGKYAFYGCTDLRTLEFAEDSAVSTIGTYAFANCSSLGKVVLPAGLGKLSSKLFLNCTSLTDVTLFDSYKLGTAFQGCTGLRVLWYHVPVIDEKTGNVVSYNDYCTYKSERISLFMLQ